MTKVVVSKGETLEKALRIFKKKLDRDGTLKQMKVKNHYEKPSERKKRKAKNAQFSQW
ncbi:MAG: 30S ribosomal protein S21 [Candidatus Omnitrophica bacterium]|nr:30S ribosomal protein S21 [Candidatus Omnitrophota bacterium]